MPTRSILAEQNALKTFTRIKGRTPVSGSPTYAADMAALHRIAYPTLNDLPDEFKSTEAASYYNAGVNPAPTAPSAPTAPLSLQQRVDQASVAKDEANQAIDEMPTSNTALRVLQQAIKAKAAPSDFSQASIGESEIFKQAGVGGYGALASSLNARGKEIDDNRTYFANRVSEMADEYRGTAERAQRRYEVASDEYKTLSQLLQKKEDQMRQDEQQLKVIELQHRFDKELKEMGFAHDDANRTPSIEEVNGVSSQWDPKTKTWIPATNASSGVVLGFDIGNWAINPNNVKQVASIVQGMGQFKTLEDVDTYIKRVAPNSPITSDMISKTSEKYGIPWEMLVAMVQNESTLGTSNVALKNNNHSGITYSDSYAANHPGAMKGSARPAEEGGNYVRFASPQEGLNALGDLLAKRRTTASPKTLSPLAQQVADGVMQASTLTPTEQTSIAKELANKGVTVKQTKLTEAQQKTIESSAEAKKLTSLADFKGKLLAYKTLAEAPGGFESFGSRKAALDGMYADLKIAYKEAANLGAITGPDVAIIQEAIKPVSGYKNYPEYLASGGMEGLKTSLDTAAATIERSALLNKNLLISKYGDAAQDPYIQQLIAPFNASEPQNNGGAPSPAAGRTDPLNILSDTPNPANDPLGIR